MDLQKAIRQETTHLLRDLEPEVWAALIKFINKETTQNEY